MLITILNSVLYAVVVVLLSVGAMTTVLFIEALIGKGYLLDKLDQFVDWYNMRRYMREVRRESAEAMAENEMESRKHK